MDPVPDEKVRLLFAVVKRSFGERDANSLASSRAQASDLQARQ